MFIAKNKIAIIAGNRLFPIIFAENLRQKVRNIEIIGICFKGETSKKILRYIDKAYWISVGQLAKLKEILKKEQISQCVMAGQIRPFKIFKKNLMDEELLKLINDVDFRPHQIFGRIIKYLENEGVNFLNSTLYLEEYLATEGIMNDINLDEDVKKDIDFGMDIVRNYVKLDVGQVVVVKMRSVVALETIEGTDRTLLRSYKLAGGGCVVLKFSKPDQDLRFDIPIVGVSTLKILNKIKAAALVLEVGKVLILEKEKFLQLANKYKIPIVGKKS
ncbi:MAG: UDP-2,3-diacylglucosamine diphosphatase LpxI [Candidatus Omnitrophica bacterium]|nr:UDP-2,3-diacylglucosamine diphosphatase LpxI [Candidatus Omnitrophota bacterium]MCM8831126.1 UDP-2,3-diacylglucosamine diphosphatase LpxI [Candidatus Omnitrophota bacterium]